MVHDESSEDDANVTNEKSAANCNTSTLQHKNFTSFPVKKKEASQQRCSTGQRSADADIFRELFQDSNPVIVPLRIVAHLISDDDVIEGSRKAPGEVISLSLREASGWWDYSRGIHSTPKMKRFFILQRMKR